MKLLVTALINMYISIIDLLLQYSLTSKGLVTWDCQHLEQGGASPFQLTYIQRDVCVGRRGGEPAGARLREAARRTGNTRSLGGNLKEVE